MEFVIDFVVAGTNIPMVQAEVPLTAIDIDGYEFPDDKLYECDEFEESAAFYINYPGIDTVQKDVMFTAVHSGVSSVRFRVGVDNNSVTGRLRLRSVYFKKFTYSSGLLPLFGLLSFTGFRHQDKTVLNWELAANCSFTNITVERSTDGKYNFSNVLLIKGKTSVGNGFKIYPNIISSVANISLYTDKKERGILIVSDYSGKIVKQENLDIQQGSNSIQVNGLERLSSGNYIVVIRKGNEVHNQKIVIR